MPAILAIVLSLATTNDYQYVKFPTNWTPQIVGVGLGPYENSTAIRAEDMFFLTEAMREREFVAFALSSNAETNYVPRKLAIDTAGLPIPTLDQYHELSLVAKECFSGTLSAKCSGLITGKRNVTEPFSREWTSFSPERFSQFMTNFYESGSVPSSRCYERTNINTNFIAYTGFAYPYNMIVKGVCTNLYADILANVYAGLIQPIRYGPSGATRRSIISRYYNGWSTGYNPTSGELYFRSDEELDNSRVAEAPFLTFNGEICTTSSAGYRQCYIYRRQGGATSTGRGDETEAQQIGYNGVFCFTIPEDVAGSNVIELNAVFACVELNVVESVVEQKGISEYDTTTVTNFTKRYVAPVSFSKIGSDDKGCPAYGLSIDGQDLQRQALRFFSISQKTPEQMLTSCPDANVPVFTYSWETFKSLTSHSSYVITVNVPYFVAIVKVDFNAKPMEHNE